ncbi:MAG: aspartate kinase [Treponema sp.]|jgi:aspartate kinase|nr:aspartate kinase [Treponema sp.]
MIVMKFGGSSLADAERFRVVSDIIREQLQRKPVIVLSALGDTTDYLLEAGDMALKTGNVSMAKIRDNHLATVTELNVWDSIHDYVPLQEELLSLLMGISMIRELTPRTKDYLVSFGERFSARIMAAYLRSIGINAQAFDAWDIGFVSDSAFTRADLLKESWDIIPQHLNPLLDTGIVPVITGFIAKDHDGNITTLGRGGSDRSATIIAAACLAEEVQIWKDVDGILTADPRIVPHAQPVLEISYEEASELAYFGAQVLHPRALRPCFKTNTPVIVKNSYNPSALGTKILKFCTGRTYPVIALTARNNITLVDIVSTRMLGQPGFLAKVFACFAHRDISVDILATSEVSLSLTLDAEYDIEQLKPELEQIAAVTVQRGMAIITLIVADVYRTSEVLHRAFGVCTRSNVQVLMVSQGATKVNISFIIEDRHVRAVIQALHAEFFAPQNKELKLR